MRVRAVPAISKLEDGTYQVTDWEALPQSATKSVSAERAAALASAETVVEETPEPVSEEAPAPAPAKRTRARKAKASA